MLSSDKSRGYWVEMIGGDLWVGANLGKENPTFSCSLPYDKFLPAEERQKFVHHVTEKVS